MTDLTCKVCMKEYESTPVILPCGWTVCSDHLECDDLADCVFCHKSHHIDDGGQYPINKPLEISVNQKKVQESLRRADEKIDAFRTLQIDPHQKYVYKYYESMVVKVEQRRDEIIKAIQAHFEPMVIKLKELRDKPLDGDDRENIEQFKIIKLDNFEAELGKIKEETKGELQIDNSNFRELDAQLFEGLTKIIQIEMWLDTKLDGLLDNTTYELTSKAEEINYDELFGQLLVHNKTKGKLNKTLTGHEGGVNALIMLKDGHLCSASRDKTVKIWKLDEEKCIKTLTGHQGPVNTLILGPNNELISGSDDTNIIVWNVETGEEEIKLEGHKLAVWCLAVAMKQGHLISGSRDKTIKFWDLEAGFCFKSISSDQNAISALVITRHGELVSGSIDKLIKVWNLETGVCTRSFTGHTQGVKALILNKKGELISSSGYGPIKIWNLSNGECLKTLFDHTSGTYALSMTRDGDLITGSDDHTIKVWNLRTETCTKTLTGHDGPLNALLVRRDREVISASVDKTIRIWKI